jgi:hypothetical protein
MPLPAYKNPLLTNRQFALLCVENGFYPIDHEIVGILFSFEFKWFIYLNVFK